MSRTRSLASPPARPRSRRRKSAPATTRRQEERDRARAKILKAATHLFAQRGIENVTFGDIARRARMSRPLVYFYFPDLRTLFLETAHLASSRLHERMTAAISGARTGLESILAMGRTYVDFHEEEPELFYRCMASVGPQPNSRRASPTEERIIQLERTMMELVEAAVSRGVRDGSVRPDVGNNLTVALSLWAFVQGLVQLGSGHRDTIERFCGMNQKSFLDAGFATLRGALKPIQ